MRVGVIQSCYIPWRGYFDFIASVDLFVIYDDVQYSTGSWRNRNKIKTAQGLRWLTVPVVQRLGMAIDEVRIGTPAKPWRSEHQRLLEESLGSAPHFADAFGIWRAAVSANDEFLGRLNLRLICAINTYLGINTPIVPSRDYHLTGSKTERLVQLLRAVGAGTYLSGPNASSYLDVEMLNSAGIAVEYKSYDYAPYTQLWGEFCGTVTVLDLIANCGTGAREYLRSTTPNRIATFPATT